MLGHSLQLIQQGKMKSNAEKSRDFSDKLNQHFISLGIYTYLSNLMSFVVRGSHNNFSKFDFLSKSSQLQIVQYLLLKT